MLLTDTQIYNQSDRNNPLAGFNKKDRWNRGNTRPPTNSLLCPDKGGNKLLANICMPHKSPTTQNLGDHNYDLSNSLKVKCHGVIGLAIYGFLLMVNNIRPSLAPLGDIRL